jgi:hypothetical protein
MFRGSTPEIGGISWVSVGMNYFILDKVTVGIRSGFNDANFKHKYNPVFNMFEERKARWRECAKNMPSLYQYLKDNIHTDSDQSKEI